MVRLAAAVEESLAPLGYPTEQHAFTPHVTLARVKDTKNSNICKLISNLSNIEIARVEVRDVALMRSELGAGGSRYFALHRSLL